MDRVKFYFDPRCPWCYQTSRWARQLEALGEIELDWGVFSLEVVNRPDDTDPRDLEPTGSPALRTAVTIAETHGSRALGGFYAALGRRVFEEPPPPDDMIAAIRESLEEVGLDPNLSAEALGDPATWDAVVDETNRIVQRIGKLGVPTIVLDDDDGPTIFGPVISELPSDGDAVELWRHTAWLVRNSNFAELKRDRARRPDLPTIAWHVEQQAAAEREAART